MRAIFFQLVAIVNLILFIYLIINLIKNLTGKSRYFQFMIMYAKLIIYKFFAHTHLFHLFQLYPSSKKDLIALIFIKSTKKSNMYCMI